MSKPVSLYAALEIPRAAGAGGAIFLRGIADVLGRHDGGLSAVRISAKHCAVAAASLIVKVEITSSPATGARICFRLAGRPGRAAPNTETAVAVLSDIVMRALPLAEADHVEWLQPGARLTPEEFLAAQSYISPKRARPEPTVLPDTDASVDTIDRNLTQLLQDERSLFEAPAPAVRRGAAPKPSPAPRPEMAEETLSSDQCSDRRAQAASWSFTALVSTLSMPVGLVLAVIHALRGSDMRLSIQALVLTGTGQVMWNAGLFDSITRLSGS